MANFSYQGVYEQINQVADTITANGFLGDPDVSAVIEAIEDTGVSLTSTQKTAITDRIGAAKDDSLWDLMTRHYGFVGGTAAAHAINWKNPETKTITYVGSGCIHSATGIRGRYSTSNYGNLGPLNSEFTDQDACSVVYYLTESSPSNNDTIFGVYDTGTSDYFWIYHRGDSQSFARRLSCHLWSASRTGDTAVAADEGYASYIKKSVTTTQHRMNDAKKDYPNSSACDVLTEDCYLFAVNWVNAGSVGQVGSETLGSLTFFDDTLTDTQDNANRTAEVAFQTALSRN